MNKKKKNMDKKKFKQFCYVLRHFLKIVLPRLSLVAFWNNELFFLCAQFSLGPTDVLHRLHWCQYLKVFTICIFNQSAKQPCKKRWDNIFKKFFSNLKIEIHGSWSDFFQENAIKTQSHVNWSSFYFSLCSLLDYKKKNVWVCLRAIIFLISFLPSFPLFFILLFSSRTNSSIETLYYFILKFSALLECCV